MIMEYISGIEVNFEEYIRYHEEEKMSYIPCNETLAAIEGFWVQDGLGNKTLVSIFRNPVSEKFEYILFDCPTNVDGLLVSNSYKEAADKLIIPVQAEPECYEGVSGTIPKMMSIKQNDKLPDINRGLHRHDVPEHANQPESNGGVKRELWGFDFYIIYSPAGRSS